MADENKSSILKKVALSGAALVVLGLAVLFGHKVDVKTDGATVVNGAVHTAGQVLEDTVNTPAAPAPAAPSAP